MLGARGVLMGLLWDCGLSPHELTRLNGAKSSDWLLDSDPSCRQLLDPSTCCGWGTADINAESFSSFSSYLVQ
jgi:hypothetical protein